MSGLANAASARKYRRTPFSSYRERSRFQHLPPLVRAMYVPRTQLGALAVTELVEHEQRVIARAPKVTVVRRSLLFSMYRTLRTVHVQDHPPVRRAGHSSVHPRSVHSAQPLHVAVLGTTSVSNRLMVLVLAAGLSMPRLQRLPASSDRRPTVQHRWYPRSLPDDCTPTACRRPTNRCCTLRPPRLPADIHPPSPSVPVHHPTRDRPAAQRPR